MYFPTQTLLDLTFSDNEMKVCFDNDLDNNNAFGDPNRQLGYVVIRVHAESRNYQYDGAKPVFIRGLLTENIPLFGLVYSDVTTKRDGDVVPHYNRDGSLNCVDVVCSISKFQPHGLYDTRGVNTLIGVRRAIKIMKIPGARLTSGLDDGMYIVSHYNDNHTDITPVGTKVLAGPLFINVPHSVHCSDWRVVNLVKEAREYFAQYLYPTPNPVQQCVAYTRLSAVGEGITSTASNILSNALIFQERVIQNRR